MQRVTLDRTAEDNGLGMLLENLISQNLEDHPDRIAVLDGLDVTVGITARDEDSKVEVTLDFLRGNLIIYDGICGTPDLHIITEYDKVIALSSLPVYKGIPNYLDEVGLDVLLDLLTGDLTIKGIVPKFLELNKVAHILSVNEQDSVDPKLLLLGVADKLKTVDPKELGLKALMNVRSLIGI